MNKGEFEAKYAEKTHVTKKDAKEHVGVFFDLIMAVLAAGDELVIPGFGKFEVKERNERTARNPQTGEMIIVPAVKAVHFKAGKFLKDAVNQK